MRKTNPNDPAAPCKVLEGSNNPYVGNHLKRVHGLTKRELFAKDFMAALVSHYGDENCSNMAKIARDYADALISKLNET